MSTHAPYNFVPFAEKPLRRYDSPDKLPAHGTWDPKLLSGEIRLTITAKTPIYIGNGGKGASADFFRSPNGSYAIPGSTLRGLVRENMQILGFGLLRRDEDYQNYRIFYRRMADKKGSIGEPLKKHYQAILDIQNQPPKEVRGGFLYCDKNGKYYISVVDTFYLAKKNLEEHKAWKDLTAEDRSIFYKPEGTTKHGEPTVLLSAIGGEGWRKGTLHCVGWMENPKDHRKDQNTLYVFPEPTEDAQIIPLSDDEIISYREDYEARKNSLGGTGKHKMSKLFWALPEKGEKKPVFFFQKGGFTSFGMSLYLRIAYTSSIEAGLPETYQRLADQGFMDYPNAIFGYAAKTQSYRSRVCFSDLQADCGNKQPELLQAQLGEPKISFFPGYSRKGEHYDVDGYRFRGFKQYWLKNKGTKLQSVTDPQNMPKSSTGLRPLPAGTKFAGSIRYRNLYPDELGLLLWCMILDKGCQQNIGMGKPYGYGRIDVHIDSLWEQEPKMLYGEGSLLNTPAPLCDNDVNARVEALIKAYTESAMILSCAKKGIREVPIVRDFLGMKRQIISADDEQFSYMPLGDFRNLDEPLPTAHTILKELQRGNANISPSSSVPSKNGDDGEECEVSAITPLGVQVKLLSSGRTGIIIDAPKSKVQPGKKLIAKVFSEKFGLLQLSFVKEK